MSRNDYEIGRDIANLQARVERLEAEVQERKCQCEGSPFAPTPTTTVPSCVLGRDSEETKAEASRATIRWNAYDERPNRRYTAPDGQLVTFFSYMIDSPGFGSGWCGSFDYASVWSGIRGQVRDDVRNDRSAQARDYRPAGHRGRVLVAGCYAADLTYWCVLVKFDHRDSQWCGRGNCSCLYDVTSGAVLSGRDAGWKEMVSSPHPSGGWRWKLVYADCDAEYGVHHSFALV